MREEENIRERLIGLQHHVDRSANEWTKEHLRTRIDELEWVLEEVRQK